MRKDHINEVNVTQQYNILSKFLKYVRVLHLSTHLSIEERLSTSFPKNASCFEPFECLEQKAAYMTDRHIAAASIHIQSVSQSAIGRQRTTR